MFCTEKQRKHCDYKKRGCEGCYYNNDLNNIEKVMFPIKEENLLKDGNKITKQGIIRKE